MTVDESNYYECSEDCKHLKSLYLLSSELDMLNKLLSHQKKSIEEQQMSIKLLLAQCTRPICEHENFPPPRLARKNIVTKLWITLGILLIISVAGILIYVFYPDEASDSLQPSFEYELDKHPFFTRSNWGARPAKFILNVTKPVDMVIIKHTADKTCTNFQDCSKLVRHIQRLDASKGNPDINCSFFISSDGSIFEGRGWGVQPQYRNDTMDVVFMGTYDIDVPSAFMIDAALVLLKVGVKMEYLTKDFKVVCHNQTTNTLSPGQNIFKEVMKWPHYDPNLYFNNQMVSQVVKLAL